MTNPTPRAWIWRDINGDQQANFWERPAGDCVPLYDQATLDAAIAAEREACAKVCEDEAGYRLLREQTPLQGDFDPTIQGHKAATAQNLGRAIRARSKP